MTQEQELFADILSRSGWNHIEKVEKGWSSDSKYKIITQADEALLLRISDISKYEVKKKEYEIISKYVKLGFEMSFPKAFGICNGGRNCYMLLAWVNGEDLEEALPNLPVQEQYRLGRAAGTILQSIHSIPVQPEDLPEHTKKAKKLAQLERYENSSVRIDNDEPILRFIKQNIDKIWREKPVYMHGDFHPGNLVLTPEHNIGVIDFNRWEIGDPYEEFYKLESFGVEVSIPYCIGQIDAYFNDSVPGRFWETLAVYAAHASLSSIRWAEKFGQEDIDNMTRRCYAALQHYDWFRRMIPAWYMDSAYSVKTYHAGGFL